MSAQWTWRALDEAGEARTAANCQACPSQMLAFSAQLFCWPCNLSQERYNCSDSGSKKEIPVNSGARIAWRRSLIQLRSDRCFANHP